MLASVVHILPLATIRRERVLPVPGRVLVRQGQKVEPRDVIAEANLAPEHLLLDVSRSLGMSTKKVKSLIQREVGEDVAEGDLIAGPVGITRRVLRAPVSGRIELIQDGKVMLQVETAPYELRAGFPGVVNDLIADRGAVIETQGALVQGVWGNGRIDFGLLQNKLESPEAKINRDQLDVSLRGAVVLGGYCEDPKTLKNAAEIPLRGLILSSMSAALAPLAAKMPFSVVVLRGFGFQSLDSASYNLLKSNQNREIALNAVALDRFAGTRPEVIIPLPTSENHPYPMETEDYGAGQKVRLVHTSEKNSIGTIERILDQSTVLPSGLRAVAASVTLENNKSVVVPLANLEILT